MPLDLKHTRTAHWWRGSLAAKFVLLVAGLTALTLGATGWFSYHAYRNVYLGHLHSKVEVLAQFVASISPDRIFSNDLTSLYSYVRELSQTNDLTYAVVTNVNGAPMTAYLNRANPIIADAIREVGSEDMRKVMEQVDRMPDSLSITAPIVFNKENVGVVVIGATRRFVDQALVEILFWNVLGSAFIIVLLSGGIYLVFRQNILRPAGDLMAGARRVARGDLHEPIPIVSEDELGHLAGSFNEMMVNLDRSQTERAHALDELREFNHTLETRVEERTRALESVNRELERLALYDALTDLPNRTLLQDRLRQAIKTSERTRATFSVMLMDLDRFKEVNDTFGHHTGDQLLKQVGRRLLGALQGSDTVGRLGGDEFALLLPGTNADSAVLVARKIFKALEQPVEMEGLSFVVGASVGIALYPAHGIDASSLLKHADIAMYAAKQTKGGYCTYHKDIDIHSPRRLQLINDLRVAVDAGQMLLHYQPIFEVGVEQIHAVEALARWQHPEKGLISPEQFIPMLEQTGLIRSFTIWAIDTALRQWVAWRAQGVKVAMSVNLSMHNLQDKEFPHALAELMRKWSVTPHALILEVTESAMMSDPNHALKTLADFRQLGVDVAIDDFGTGYSSLSYLKRLPVNKLKIDRSFVKSMLHDKDDAVIVRSTIDLAHNLGLLVIAEGVEDVETLRLLTALKCDFVQGYYFSKPLAEEQLAVIDGCLTVCPMLDLVSVVNRAL